MLKDLLYSFSCEIRRPSSTNKRVGLQGTWLTVCISGEWGPGIRLKGPGEPALVW